MQPRDETSLAEASCVFLARWIFLILWWYTIADAGLWHRNPGPVNVVENASNTSYSTLDDSKHDWVMSEILRQTWSWIIVVVVDSKPQPSHMPICSIWKITALSLNIDHLLPIFFKTLLQSFFSCLGRIPWYKTTRGGCEESWVALPNRCSFWLY